MTKRRIHPCMRLLVTASLLVLAACARGQDAYVIGISADTSGPAAGSYAPVVEGLKAYLDNVNGRGGVNGRPVRLVVQNNQSEPARAGADAKKLLAEDKVVLLVNAGLSSTYAPMVTESRRANVPLYFAGGVCPRETYPPADPLQFCSTAFAANLDSQAALAFVKHAAKGQVRLGLAAMAIPIARAEIDYAEKLSGALGMAFAGKEITPAAATEYTPFAAHLKAGNPNWVYSWSPWVAQLKTLEALRKQGWTGNYITWAHAEAEDELARLKDGNLYVIGANALLQDDVPMHAEMRAISQRAKLQHPLTQLTEGFVAGMVVEATLKDTMWPPTPAKVQAAMSRLKVDTRGLRGGALEWTAENHFRDRQYYRVWRWDPAVKRIARVQDWTAIEVKR